MRESPYHDKWAWHHTNKGVFTVKYAYHVKKETNRNLQQLISNHLLTEFLKIHGKGNAAPP